MDFRGVLIWAVVIFVAMVMFLTGIGTIVQPGPWQQFFARWGLPGWLVPIVGLAEVAGAVMIVRTVWRRRTDGR